MPNFTNNFPDWGDSGQSPPNGFQYSAGDQLREDHLDFLWYEIDTLTDNLVTEFERYDSDNSGVVDEAEVAQSLSTSTSIDANSYKGNDIDTDADGVVDEAATLNGFTETDFYQPDGSDTFIVETRTSDPSSPQEGQAWIRTDL